MPTASTSASASCPASSTKSTSSGRSAEWMSTVSRVNAQAVPATSWNDGSAQTSASSDETMDGIDGDVSASSASRARRAPRNAKPWRSASCWIARSMLWIALWLSEVTPTRLPARISSIAMRAPATSSPSPAAPGRRGSSRPSVRAAPTGSRSSRTSRRAPFEQRGERRVARRAGRPRTRCAKRKSASRFTLSPIGPPGVSPRGKRLFLPLGAAEEGDDAVVVVDLDAERLLRAGVEGPAGQLVLLRREGEAVGVAPVPRPPAARRPSEARRSRCGRGSARPRRAAASGTTPTIAAAPRAGGTRRGAPSSRRGSPSSVPASRRSRSAARATSQATVSSFGARCSGGARHGTSPGRIERSHSCSS